MNIRLVPVHYTNGSDILLSAIQILTVVGYQSLDPFFPAKLNLKHWQLQTQYLTHRTENLYNKLKIKLSLFEQKFCLGTYQNLENYLPIKHFLQYSTKDRSRSEHQQLVLKCLFSRGHKMFNYLCY